jgi:Tol biopolymer transport system component
MKTGKAERISVSSSGKQQTLGNIYDYGYGGISLSFDGRYVSFVSQGTNFAKGISTNTCHYTIGLGVDEPCANIYLHDRQTGQTSIISISGSNKSGNADSSSPSMSQDGQWIAFASSASNLVAGDTNGQSDIFLYHR